MEDKIFELMEKLYRELSSFRSETNEKFEGIDKRFEGVDKRFDNLESDVKSLKKDIIRIENDLKPKIEAALDGYKQHTDILERIEKEVSRQDEIIMRRIK
ncbi:MAG: hypothetical protein ACOZCL_11765 [Bacillota bacterium]